MKISRKNYEAYFLDYRENNLKPDQVAELLIFLEQNPDLKDEFESFETIQLTPEQNIRFVQKDSLKKKEMIPTDHINRSNYEEFMVAGLEGDLSENDRVELKAFTELNPPAKLEYNIFRKTFLKPDLSIQFENKEKLKKIGWFVLYRKPVYYSVAVAATIILLLGVYFGFVDHPQEASTIVSVETPAIPPLNSQPQMTLIDDSNPVVDRNELPVKSDPVQASVEQQENDRIGRVAENFRMKNLSGLTEIPVENDRLILAGNRNNDSILAVLASDETVRENQKSFVSRFITGLAGKVIKIEKPERKSFLEYTIEGYNLMADKNVSLEKEVDDTGKVIAYTLDGENLSFFRNRSQQKD